MDNEKFTNQKRLVHVRNAYGKWKQYKIVFENETHWDRWIEKMWSWDYKLECVYTYVDCKACGKEHIKDECFDSSPPFEWTDELVLQFAKVTTQGGYGEYRGCKSVQSKLERFKLVSSRTLKDSC